MAIVLRNIKGKTVALDDNTPFIELRTVDDKLGCLIIHREGALTIYTPDDPEFTAYAARFNVPKGKLARVDLADA